MERAEEIAGIVTAETGGTFGWGMFNCSLAADMLNEAAAQTTAVRGEVIPSNVPGLTAIGIRQPAGAVWGSRPGTRRSSSEPARSRRRSPAATQWCSRDRRSARAPTPRSPAR